jgi:hypothetical protein
MSRAPQGHVRKIVWRVGSIWLLDGRSVLPACSLDNNLALTAIPESLRGLV